MSAAGKTWRPLRIEEYSVFIEHLQRRLVARPLIRKAVEIASDQGAYDRHLKERREVEELKAERAAQIERNRQAARSRGRSISEAADARRQLVVCAAAEYRAQHPYDAKRHSTRRMARELASEVGQPYNTVRGTLRSLGIH